MYHILSFELISKVTLQCKSGLVSNFYYGGSRLRKQVIEAVGCSSGLPKSDTILILRLDEAKNFMFINLVS